MIDYRGLFAAVVEWVYSLVCRSNGIDLPEAEHPKLKDRTPYPREGPVEILPPVDDAKTIQKRKAIDKEFWETL